MCSAIPTRSIRVRCCAFRRGVIREVIMFGILGWVLFGLIVGIIATLLMPGKDPGGFVITALLGIAGALLGGAIGRFAGLYAPGEPAGLLMSTLGAIVLLFLYKKMRPTAALH